MKDLQKVSPQNVFSTKCLLKTFVGKRFVSSPLKHVIRNVQNVLGALKTIIKQFYPKTFFESIHHAIYESYINQYKYIRIHYALTIQCTLYSDKRGDTSFFRLFSHNSSSLGHIPFFHTKNTQSEEIHFKFVNLS